MSAEMLTNAASWRIQKVKITVCPFEQAA